MHTIFPFLDKKYKVEMIVTTPVTKKGPSFTHTPPSRDSVTSSPAAKFFKNISGRSIKRIGNKFRWSSESPNKNNNAANCPMVQTPYSHQLTQQINVFSDMNTIPMLSSVIFQHPKRRPTPLDLKMLSPPITVEHSAVNDGVVHRLGTPVKMEFSKNLVSPSCNLLANLLESAKSSGSHRLDMLDFSLNNCDNSSPSALMVMQPRSVAFGTPESKRYTVNVCCMCREYLNSLLDGEKVVEMTCNHQSHYYCYLAVLEKTYSDFKYPKCEICNKESKPKNEEMIHAMISSLLLKQPLVVSPNNVKEHVLRLQSSQVERPLYNIYTPSDQLIKSSDISSNGFINPMDSCIQEGHEFGYNKVSSSVDLAQSALSSVLLDVTQDQDQDQVRVNIIPQVSKVVVNGNPDYVMIPYVLNSYLKQKDGYHELADIDDEELKSKINMHIHTRLGTAVTNAGTLKLFDRLEYSFCGEKWSSIIFYWFENYFILAEQTSDQNSNPIIVGKIEITQLSKYFKYDAHTLILDLKSMSFPEIYLKSPDNNPSVINKWNYYLNKRFSSIPITQITTNSWSILPGDILNKQLKRDILGVTGTWSISNISTRSRDCVFHNDTKLQLVVAVSLINYYPEIHDNEELLKIIKSKLLEILDSLNEDDLFGLVVSNDEAQHGKFYGMVSKNWELWDEVINSLDVTGNVNLYMDEVSELHHMMKVSTRLISTVEKPCDYIRKLVLLGNDYKPLDISMEVEPLCAVSSAISKYATTILREHKFSIYQFVTYNSKALVRDYIHGFADDITTRIIPCTADIYTKKIIKTLHQTTVQRLRIVLETTDPSVSVIQSIEQNARIITCNTPSVELEFGPFVQGTAKNILFEVRLATDALTRFSNGYHQLLKCSYFSSYTQKTPFYGTCLGLQLKFQPTSSPCTQVSLASLLAYETAVIDPNDSFLDISLVPPLSSSPESIFVTRQLQLLTINTLNSILKDAKNILPSANFPSPSSRLKELRSVLFGISHNCVSSLPQYYAEMGKHLEINNYIESLCGQLDTIVQSYEESYLHSNTCQIDFQSFDWINKARVLVNKLM